MEALCQDLGIPRKQIKETKHPDRYVVIAHKSWLQCLITQNSVIPFHVHPGFDEWPGCEEIGQDWSLTYFMIYKKYTHKVIPLPNCRKDSSDTDAILNFSQLLQNISATNHRNLWKNAFDKYSGQRSKVQTKESINRSERMTINLVPYDSVLLEAIIRTYGCNVINAKFDKMKSNDEPRADNKRHSTELYGRFESHVNLYPISSLIETNSHFVIVYDTFLENTLNDCVTYSPAVLNQSHSKPLFLVYQLLQLMKTIHDRGLLLGNIGLDDIFVTDNLWLQVMPRLNVNILQSIETTVEQPNSVTRKTYAPMYGQLSMTNYVEMWCSGQLSNFDYLTILNNLSGRRMGDPSFHHIMPWVTDFISRNGMNWRDLTKSKYRLNKGDVQLDLMFVPTIGTINTTVPHHVSDVLSEITYYVYMARRTPKSVLCKHVRPIWVPHEYPISISRLYDWTPDECIPEFFTDPLVFKSIHEDLPNLEIPAWSSCPEDFVTKHREALESQYVSERLHHWIDLNFGYKLSGNAAIKSKNVYLSMVDNHQSLCRRGIVPLFNHPHPPKQYQTIWTSKTPPRIYSQNEIRRRLTRSTDDLSNVQQLDQNDVASGVKQDIPSTADATNRATALRSSSKSGTHSSHVPEDPQTIGIERSPSLHSTNLHKKMNQIILPKDYNPVAALNAVENMEVFLSKTFYKNMKEGSIPSQSIDHPSTASNVSNVPVAMDEGINAFTNKIFSECYEENLRKDSKRLHNLNHKNLVIQSSTRNYKQIISDHRQRELKVIACLIVEIFLAEKLRPLGVGSMQSLEDRIEICKNVLIADFNLLPKCVQYPVKLMFQFTNDSNEVMSDIGLPKPSANQFLQPFLCNFLFPFPYELLNVFTLLKSLYQYESANRLLDIQTYFECNGNNCRKFDLLDKHRTVFRRKIAECKVMACAAQIEKLLLPHGYELFSLVDLVLPHIIDLLTTESTSILSAWFLFDYIAVALGPIKTRQHLLEPILTLYDTQCDERVAFLNSNFDSSMKFTSGASFKSRKTIKLYHHSFLLRLIVRFGLSCFLNNFVPPLVEAIGGYKEPVHHSFYHYHENGYNGFGPQMGDNQKNEIVSSSPKRASDGDEMFSFDNDNDADDIQKSSMHVINLTDSSDNDTDTVNQIVGDFDISCTDDLQLNHSNAMEVTEDTTLSESGFRLTDTSGISFEENHYKNESSNVGDSESKTSPTIPIPSSSKRNQLNTIDCEIGSKKSTESADLLDASMAQKTKKEKSVSISTVISTNNNKSSSWNDQQTQTQYQISDMSAESLIWLSHRLGPVLTARHLTRNLLKMLTLCYVGQENILPDDFTSNDDNIKNLHDNLLVFSIADGRVCGDRSAVKVLECLTSITTIYGEHFVLLQYLPHVTELIAMCKKRITPSLEGGLISSLQLLKYLVPCLSDTVIMDQLHDTLLKSIIHPIIRLIASTRFLMPNGFLARSVLARKVLDAIYVLAVRIGPEMTKSHLCVPSLQRFYLIFDKAHEISDNFSNDLNDDSRNSPTFDDANFIEIRRDGGTKEWSIKGSPLQIITARTKEDAIVNSITPPKQSTEDVSAETAATISREKALDEIKEVFTPQLAHVSYVPFLKYLGDHIMKQFVKNLPLILTLCHEFEQPEYASFGYNSRRDSMRNKSSSEDISMIDGSGIITSSFGTAMIGNRIEVYKENEKNEKNEIRPVELLDLITYKYDQISTMRHLRGNWLAYWEHEIGRSEKNNHFNFKQIKLQTFAGHSNSVRSLTILDNENSFMSASKDKTVKLWSLRSEGDGSKISSCQFSYTNHRKSVHSLAFLESLRLAVSCDSSVHIWDPFVGGDIGQLESSKYAPVSIVKTYPAPSSLILAGTAESTVKIIDARTFSYVNEWKFSQNQLSGSVRCMAMSPSATWFAVGLSSGQLILCDARTGMIIATWKATDGDLLQLSANAEDQLISTSLDQSVCVWSTIDGTLLYSLKSPNEPIHVLLNNHNELIFGTPANRIGVYTNISSESTYSITKLRNETFKGVLTSMAVLPLNHMLLVGGDSGNICLLC